MAAAVGPRARAQGASPAPVVASIQLPGRTNVPEETILGAVKMPVGQPFTPAAMETDRKAILGLGFFRSVTASQQTAAGKTDVTYRLVEWPTVKHIRVVGNTVVEKRDLHALITTKLGQVLCTNQLLQDVAAIERLYRDKGYVARVGQGILDEATRSGILRFDILEVQIAEVTFEGGTPRMRSRAEKAVQEGPPALYRPEAVAQDRRRLLEVRDVKTAVPKVETISPGKVRIRWLLNPPPEEAPPSNPPKE
jgi:outer membrane protein assembly factor BamA